MQFALEVKNVSKRFGNVLAVDDVSFQIPKGSIYGFLGPNGAGKTTTIRMIMSIFFPDSGSIVTLGNSNPEAVKDRMGYLPEEKGLYKKMKAAELLAYFGKLKGMDSSTANRKSRELLTKFGLGDWVDQKCESLSKGMGQKVQVLATLMHDPELVILDEPFSGLDPVNVEVVREMILDIKRDGRTVIFSTHVMEQAEQICDSILLVNKGRKIIDGTIEEVRSSGGKGIVIEYEGDGSGFASIPGVTRVNDAGKRAELSVVEGTDPHEILEHLIKQVKVRQFESAQPSLHEVFVRAVGADQ